MHDECAEEVETEPHSGGHPDRLAPDTHKQPGRPEELQHRESPHLAGPYADGLHYRHHRGDPA